MVSNEDANLSIPLKTAVRHEESSRRTRLLANPRVRDLVYALKFAAPALVIFILFTYMPFIRAIYLSAHVTNNVGEAVRFNGLDYYAQAAVRLVRP
jgi:ABC-type sugar transport system permease subunit